MPNFIQKRFTNPETFRKIRPDLLLAWLKQSEGYFTQRGLVLPPTGVPFNVSAFSPRLDYDALVRVFMEPTPDIPAELVDGLHLVHEMGRPKYVEDMLLEAQKNGFGLDLGPDATPTDVALGMWLRDPRGLEALHSKLEATRPRAFEYFLTDASPVPRFNGPTLEQQRELERQLGAFYEAWDRGPGTKVCSFCQQRLAHDAEEWLFVVQHGAALRRDEAMEMGEVMSRVWRPWLHAIVKYDAGRGEIGVTCDTDRERRILLKVFGRVLFGRENFFPSTSKYDLYPLVRDGRGVLTCKDVPGIEEVSMTGIEIWDRERSRRTIYQAPDIFGLVENAELKWPDNMKHLASATFAVKFWRQKRARKVTIMPSNRAIYSRDEASPILERWFEARALALAA
jgi:hypothetical protein